MKKLLIIYGLLYLLCYQAVQGQDYNYLKSATNTGNGTTTNNSNAWTDVVSVTIDVANVSYVLVTASMNMRPDGTNPNTREADYNIYRSDDVDDKSGLIRRQINSNSEANVESWGIGTLVHIFDVSAFTSGTKTFTLEHSNNNTADEKNVYTSARLTAVALTTANAPYFELSNATKRGESSAYTSSNTFVPIDNLTTDAISLPISGDIYVSASIGAKSYSASGSNVGGYRLEYSDDGGTNWYALGKALQRTMSGDNDDGIISLVGLLQNQAAGDDYKFRAAHRLVSGTGEMRTHNSNIVAVALAHEGGYSFPSFYSEVGTAGVDITGVSAPFATVTSSGFTAAADIGGTLSSLFVNSQYLVEATGLNEGTPQRMRDGNHIKVTGPSTGTAEEYLRYIGSNGSYGSCAFIGLMSGLVSEGSYTIEMQHEVNYISNPDGTEDETLNTSEVILTGFQTFDEPEFYWNGSAADNDWNNSSNWSDGVPNATQFAIIPITLL